MPAKIVLSNLDDLVHRYEIGESVVKLSREFGISEHGCAAALRRAGVNLRGKTACIPFKPPAVRRITITDIDELSKSYLSGKTLLELGLERNCSYPVIRKRLVEAGIKMRSFSDVERLKWARMREESPGQFRKLIGRMSEANKGRKRSMSAKIRKATTCEMLGLHVRRGEKEIADAIRNVGFFVTPQFAVGPYNLDLAISELGIAVEVLGSQWKKSDTAKIRKRTKYILDLGWTIIFASTWQCCSHNSPRMLELRKFRFDPIAIAKKIVTLAEILRRDKSVRGKYGMIGRHGQPISVASHYLDDLPRIPGF